MNRALGAEELRLAALLGAVERFVRPLEERCGILLLGGCFLSVGLFISSLTKNQIVAGMTTFAVFLLFWIITWIGSFSGPTVDKLTQYLSIIDHLDDFTKGVIDTSHLVYYLSFITFGLFLTAKSVDSERWRG